MYTKSSPIRVLAKGTNLDLGGLYDLLIELSESINRLNQRISNQRNEFTTNINLDSYQGTSEYFGNRLGHYLH